VWHPDFARQVGVRRLHGRALGRNGIGVAGKMVERAAHWVKLNHQSRMPKRWITFDTEASREKVRNGEIQSWAMGAAIRWRRDLKTGKHIERRTFRDPAELWQWVASYCRPGERTVCCAHNLGYDVRISGLLEHLPKLGFGLEWCNLDRNVSSMTWRSPFGSLVFMDTFTWLPMTLSKIAALVDSEKLRMPTANAPFEEWEKYCMRDAEITHLAVDTLCDFIEREDLGNWQPTGAGMSYSTWRHRFMTDKVLVHDDFDVLAAERSAMHTGRAEAWRHGELTKDTWYEVDMRSAYTHIAAECEIPKRLHYSTGAISLRQYEDLTQRFRVLCYCDVDTDTPVVPTKWQNRAVWPVGRFQTWLWDVEVNELLSEGASVRIRKACVYTKAPLLSEWATWVLDGMRRTGADIEPVVGAWLKHCGRALIGRLALRAPKWEKFGANPIGTVGISYDVDYETKAVSRLMHVGNETLIETERAEGRDSLPQITGWIMAECRVRLWWAMRAAGLENIAHVDTDSVLINSEGLARMRATYGGSFHTLWQVKDTYSHVTVYGPRNLRVGRVRKLSGVPSQAVETEPGVYEGELWHGLAADMAAGRHDRVTITETTWTVKRTDPRRHSVGQGSTHTKAISLG
jgi:hypothetical protein